LRRRALALALAAGAAFAAVAPAAVACPVCYGAAQSPLIDGARWSIVFLGGLIYLLLGGVAAMVFALRRRVRANLAQGSLNPPLAFASPAARTAKEH
jgi:hypothetical protein